MDHVVQLFKLFTLPEIDQFGDSLLEGGGRSLAKIHPLALEQPSLNISASSGLRQAFASGLRVYGRGVVTPVGFLSQLKEYWTYRREIFCSRPYPNSLERWTDLSASLGFTFVF